MYGAGAFAAASSATAAGAPAGGQIATGAKSTGAVAAKAPSATDPWHAFTPGAATHSQAQAQAQEVTASGPCRIRITGYPRLVPATVLKKSCNQLLADHFAGDAEQVVRLFRAERLVLC